MTRTLRTIAFLATLFLFAACDDSPTGIRRQGEMIGTIRPGDGRAALVIEVTPADALDSLLVGPPAHGRGALVVYGPVAGRYLVLSDTVLAPNVRFRAFVKAAIEPHLVSMKIVETARLDGTIDDGQNSSISFTR